MKYEVFTLGKHFLQVYTSKGFTLFANAKLNPNGEVVSYTDKLVRRGGSWVIDTWKFLTIKAFPQNPIYCAVFGFEDDDTEVKVNATDIDVESISGVNGQLVDIGNISLAPDQSLAVNDFGGREVVNLYIEYDKMFNPLNIPDSFNLAYVSKMEMMFKWSPTGANQPRYSINGFTYKLAKSNFSASQGFDDPFVVDIFQISLQKINGFWNLNIFSEWDRGVINQGINQCQINCSWLYGKGVLIVPSQKKVTRLIF